MFLAITSWLFCFFDLRYGGISYSPEDVIVAEESGATRRAAGVSIHIPEADLVCDSEVANKSFAYNFQRLLDRDERDNRMGTIGTLIMGGVAGSLAFGPSVFAIAAGSPELLAGCAIPAVSIGQILPTTVHHLFRRKITNPNSRIVNRRHMIATMKHVGKLGLDPLFTSTSQGKQLTLDVAV